MTVIFKPHNMFEPDDRRFEYENMHAFLSNPDMQEWIKHPTDVFIGFCVEPYGNRQQHIVTGHWLRPDGTHVWWVAGYCKGDGVMTMRSFECEQFPKDVK